ncbi:MAG TPA: GNAT family N-acetyltransferase [Phenylobacterium sp.]|uniref:GNAT family N-acetyltransferase n=1 Tax=Phenylobacterium sp. TaxID=1871053 RepID=UPI002C3BAA7F|nr:GNAT family N-acetyltransferase [Phenylobacterium sp.]HXA39380.1 GNAT family N-acetyltransferase [Phenylobacterium sp.]
MEVRRARSDELGPCADLYVRVLRETFTWLPPERHRRDEFLRAARDEEIYVAVEDGTILGVAGFYRPQGFLHSLYVDARGRGVGKALLDHIAANVRGPLSLKVQAPNLRAQAFYRREGFFCTEHGRDPGSDIAWLRLVRPERPPKS